MTPELRASLAADNAVDHANAAPNTQEAYKILLAEVNGARTKLSPSDYGKFWQDVQGELAPQMDDLALGFARQNFSSLDSNGDGRLALDELKEQKPANDLDRRMLDSLVKQYPSLKEQTRTGSWWNLYQIDPDAITREDLSVASKFADHRQQAGIVRAILPGTANDTSINNIPPGVKALLQQRGVAIKSVPGSLGHALSDYAGEHPVVGFASAIYNPETKEIITERGPAAEEAREHEIGHAIDDALAPGDKYFTDTKEFNNAVDRDLQAASRLSTKIDWQRELPTAHVFITGQLSEGQLASSGRRELFADMYQSADTKLAGKLRQLFPSAGAVIDQKLAAEGIERFAQ